MPLTYRERGTSGSRPDVLRGSGSIVVCLLANARNSDMRRRHAPSAMERELVLRLVRADHRSWAAEATCSGYVD